MNNSENGLSVGKDRTNLGYVDISGDVVILVAAMPEVALAFRKLASYANLTNLLTTTSIGVLLVSLP